jgi:hypothetical protein
MTQPLDTAILSEPSSNFVTQPLSDEMGQKVEMFFGSLPPEKQYRLENIRTIYTTVQELVAQIRQQALSTPQKLNVEIPQKLELQIRDQSGKLERVQCVLSLILDNCTVALELIRSEKPGQPEQFIGGLFIGAAAKYPEITPAVGVATPSNEGNGLATGLAVGGMSYLPQLLVDLVYPDLPQVPIKISDTATAHQAGHTRTHWTSSLVMLQEGWQPLPTETTADSNQTHPPAYIKYFQPQPPAV